MFRVKQGYLLSHLQQIDPHLLMIFSDFWVWCVKRGITPTITRIIDEKIPGISVSDTHSEGRAIDISVRGWDTTDIYNVVEYINKKYAERWGTSPAGKESQALIYEVKGTAPHFHMQVRRNL